MDLTFCFSFVMLNDDKLLQAQDELTYDGSFLGEIMTLEETAKYLKIEKSTLYKFIKW